MGIAVVQNRPATEADGRGDDTMAVLLAEFQARYYLGAASLVGQQASQFVPQIRVLDTGTPRQRLRIAALIGEVGTPDQALEILEGLAVLLDAADADSLDAGDLEAHELLTRIYEARAAGESAASTLSDAERDRLVERVGWLGALAAADEGDPERVRLVRSGQLLFALVIAMIVGGLALGFGGAAALVTFVVLWGMRSDRFGIVPPGVSVGVWAETFAIWLVLLISMPLVLAPLASTGAQAGLIAALAGFVLSLAALSWPYLRGVHFGQLCREIGLHRGRGVIVEVGCGVATYAMALPLVAVGLVIFLILSGGAAMAGGPPADPLAPSSPPAHPVLEMVAGGDLAGLVLIYLLAVVAAPVVEEIMFRGVLHRHLRRITRGLGLALSVIVSAAVGGFIFAVIHPQGVLAVPLLMAMAIGFAIGREWRDSLIAPIVAHGINNGVVITLMVVAFA